jgi:hypothetical protein
MDIEKRKQTALNTFRATYPTVSSADLQAFILGMNAMEKIYKDIEDSEDESDLGYRFNDDEARGNQWN